MASKMPQHKKKHSGYETTTKEPAAPLESQKRPKGTKKPITVKKHVHA